MRELVIAAIAGSVTSLIVSGVFDWVVSRECASLPKGAEHESPMCGGATPPTSRIVPSPNVTAPSEPKFSAPPLIYDGHVFFNGSQGTSDGAEP